MNTEKDGRFYITDIKTGRKFLVEPIGNPHVNWGDVNPATKKLEGDYGDKYRGSIDIKDSIITEENGFKNIIIGQKSQSPFDLMNNILKNN